MGFMLLSILHYRRLSTLRRREKGENHSNKRQVGISRPDKQEERNRKNFSNLTFFLLFLNGCSRVMGFFSHLLLDKMWHNEACTPQKRTLTTLTNGISTDSRHNYDAGKTGDPRRRGCSRS